MATHATPKIEAQHPPLARDAQGNLIAIPDGTTAWRLCRQTTGRPKELVGPDKRTLRFPLETTSDELADMCGADVYRVYALDEVGKVLDYIGTVDVTRESRDLRNAAPEAAGTTQPRAASAAPMSDLRFALDAMAQMMRVNSEALRAVTESQADWVKSIASTRGFFRNAPPAPPLLPDPPREDDDEDEGDDEAPPAPKNIYDVLIPIAEKLAPAVGPLVSMYAAGAGSKASSPPASPSPATDANDLASRPKWEVRDLIDLRYASEKAKARKAAAAGESPATTKASLQARVMADPVLMKHFFAIKLHLGNDDAMRLVSLGERLSEQEIDWLIQQVSAVTPEQAATLLRATLAELSTPSDTASNDAKETK